MIISDNGASPEGGESTARSTRTTSSTSSRPSSRTTSRPSTTWAAPSITTTTPGAGPTRATRPSSAGRRRPSGAAPPTRSSSPGPRRSSRHGRVPTPSTGTPSTWCRPCSTCMGIDPPESIKGVAQQPIEGVSLAATASSMPMRPRMCTPRSTTRSSAAARSTMRAGGPSAAIPGPDYATGKERGRQASVTPSTPTPSSSSTRSGSSTT